MLLIKVGHVCKLSTSVNVVEIDLLSNVNMRAVQINCEVRISPPIRQVHVHIFKVKPCAPANSVALACDERSRPSILDHPKLSKIIVIIEVL